MLVLSQALVGGVLVGARNLGDREGVRAPYDPRDPAYSETASTVQGVAATSIVVSELLLRGYSRDFEREADDEGQRYAAAAGYQPAGLRELMALMEVRLPTSKEYGYWQTHPFFDERVRGAQTRAELLKAQSGRDAADYRRRTQEVLLGYLDGGKAPAEAVALLKADALLAWPRGPRADGIRHEGLTERRDSELAQAPLARDYGALLRAYREGIAELERLDRESPLIATLRDELGELTRQARDLYPEAVKVVEGEVHETPFLEQFLSNYPDSAEVPKVALALGDAEARLGRQAEAVAHYLEAWEAGPDSSAGQRARMGLRNLAPTLDSLAALEQLAQQQDDAELASLARSRLAPVAGSFTDLANGAEYLRRYPDGELAATVTARLNSLADDLYAEVVLYQGVGDSVKALDRINQILTHAPASPAAEQIRDRAVVRG
jgi:predicted Zn-dependent protease